MTKTSNWRLAKKRNLVVINSFTRFKKRKRTQNWSASEKALLFELVKKYKDIVDNKSASLNEKNDAWTSIHKSFLESCETERNASRIKEQWGRMKALAKLEVSNYNAKLKSSKLEEAEKLKPSELSIQIWQHCFENKSTTDNHSDSDNDSEVKTTTDVSKSPEQQVLEEKIPEETVTDQSVSETVDKNTSNTEPAEARISPTREIEIVEPQIKIENETDIPSFGDNSMTQNANSEESAVDVRKRQVTVHVESVIDCKRTKLPETVKANQNPVTVTTKEPPPITVINTAKQAQPRIFVRGNLLKPTASPLKTKSPIQNRMLRIIPPPPPNKKAPSPPSSAVPLRLLLSKNAQHKIPSVITARATSAPLDNNQIEQKKKIELLDVQLECARVQKETALMELRIASLKKQMLEKEHAEKSGSSQVKMTGERGSGVGKGGGGGGSIREAGGSFGKMEAAHEDQYFYNLQKEQITKLREGLHDEISFHEEQIKRHQEAINRHKKRMADMENSK